MSPEQEQRLKTFSIAATPKRKLGNFSGSEWSLFTNWQRVTAAKEEGRGVPGYWAAHTQPQNPRSRLQVVKKSSVRVTRQEREQTTAQEGFSQAESLRFLLQVVVDFGKKKERPNFSCTSRFQTNLLQISDKLKQTNKPRKNYTARDVHASMGGHLKILSSLKIWFSSWLPVPSLRGDCTHQINAGTEESRRETPGESTEQQMPRSLISHTSSMWIWNSDPLKSHLMPDNSAFLKAK